MSLPKSAEPMAKPQRNCYVQRMPSCFASNFMTALNFRSRGHIQCFTQIILKFQLVVLNDIAQKI